MRLYEAWGGRAAARVTASFAHDGAVETDLQKRKALYDAFQTIVVSEAPIAYLNLTPYKAVYDKRLTNLPLSIWGPLSPLDEVAWAQGAAGAER